MWRAAPLVLGCRRRRVYQRRRLASHPRHLQSPSSNRNGSCIAQEAQDRAAHGHIGCWVPTATSDAGSRHDLGQALQLLDGNLLELKFLLEELQRIAALLAVGRHASGGQQPGPAGSTSKVAALEEELRLENTTVAQKLQRKAEFIIREVPRIAAMLPVRGRASGAVPQPGPAGATRTAATPTSGGECSSTPSAAQVEGNEP